MKVLKKLWGYIKRKRNRVTVVMKITLECEKTEELNAKVDVKVKGDSKKLLIDTVGANFKLTKADAGRALDATIESIVKLKGFKAMEPEI